MPGGRVNARAGRYLCAEELRGLTESQLMAPSTRSQAGKTATSGRWSLSTKGAGARLVYRPAKSEEEVGFDLSADQLAQARQLAAGGGSAAALRDVVLGTVVRIELLQSSGTSSVVASNTWRWALPLFGGEPPTERTRPARPRRRKFQ